MKAARLVPSVCLLRVLHLTRPICPVLRSPCTFCGEVHLSLSWKTDWLGLKGFMQRFSFGASTESTNPLEKVDLQWLASESQWKWNDYVYHDEQKDKVDSTKAEVTDCFDSVWAATSNVIRVQNFLGFPLDQFQRLLTCENCHIKHIILCTDSVTFDTAHSTVATDMLAKKCFRGVLEIHQFDKTTRGTAIDWRASLQYWIRWRFRLDVFTIMS